MEQTSIYTKRKKKNINTYDNFTASFKGDAFLNLFFDLKTTRQKNKCGDKHFTAKYLYNSKAT